MDYETYIKSQRWQKKKIEFWKIHDKKCVSCGTTESIHLHHASYDRLGNESMDDLVPLCDVCHNTLHRMHKDFDEMSLSQFTKEFLTMKKTPDESELTPRQLQRIKRDKQIRSKKKIKSWSR